MSDKIKTIILRFGILFLILFALQLCGYIGSLIGMFGDRAHNFYNPELMFLGIGSAIAFLLCIGMVYACVMYWFVPLLKWLFTIED